MDIDKLNEYHDVEQRLLKKQRMQMIAYAYDQQKILQQMNDAISSLNKLILKKNKAAKIQFYIILSIFLVILLLNIYRSI